MPIVEAVGIAISAVGEERRDRIQRSAQTALAAALDEGISDPLTIRERVQGAIRTAAEA